MLDAFKTITGGKNKHVQKQTDELQSLITTAREERNAISAMLTTLTARSSKLAPLGKSLEQVTEKATAITTKLDDLAKRLATLDDRTKELEEVDKRIQALKDAAKQAEAATQKALGPDGELQKHREAVQHLSSQALQTQTALETLKKERASLEELRGHLHEADAEVKNATAQAATLKGELDSIRSTASTLTQDYTKLRDVSREAREDTNAAAATVKEIEQKLVPLVQLHDLSKSTEERLTSLNALAEHVSRKAKALETQQQAVEHAVVQANRVNEMVWAMDVQINKLTEGMKQAARAEEAIGRMGKLADETSTKAEAAAGLSQDVQRETTRLQRDSAALLDTLRAEMGALNLRKKEFEAFDERMRALHGSVTDAEARMETVASKEKNIIALTQNVDALAKRFDTLLSQSEELTKRQLALESLNDQLAQLDDLSKKTAWQMETLKLGRQDLDGLKKEIQDFYKSHAEVVQLRDKLGADRTALEAFNERMNLLAVRAPELESKMDAILGKLVLVDEGAKKATRLQETIADLDGQLSRVSARVPFVETLETRLNGLNEVSAEVDRKLAEQLARRAELDTLKGASDGLAQQMADAQAKLDDVRALQQRLVPLVAELNALRTQIHIAQDRIATVKYDESTILDQQKRFEELVAASRTIATDAAERTRQMQALSEELGRSGAIKDELIAELDRVQNRQRDAVSQIQAAEDQLARAEKMFKQLEQRRTQVAFGEKKLAGVESRLAEIKQLADGLEKNIQAVASREQLVSAVKAEVDQVHEISARSKADLAHVSENRNEITALKTRVDELLSRMGETAERMDAIDARRRQVDEVHTKANAIVHLLEDVRINLETLGEQKAVVDHVAEKVAQLEFMLQEARTTLRTLQHERELAERIEEGIKQLRSRTA